MASRAGGTALYNSDQREQALANMATIQGDAVFLLKDFVRYCENDKISRRLRDLADGFRTARRSIVLMAATIELPKELVADAAEFQLELPSNKKQQLSTQVLLGEIQSVTGAEEIAAIREWAKSRAVPAD